MNRKYNYSLYLLILLFSYTEISFAGEIDKISKIFSDKPFLLLPSTPERASEVFSAEVIQNEAQSNSYAYRYGATEEIIVKSCSIELIYWLINGKHNIQYFTLYKKEKSIPWSSLLGLKLNEIIELLGKPDLLVNKENRIEYYYKAYFISIYFSKDFVDKIFIGKQI